MNFFSLFVCGLKYYAYICNMKLKHITTTLKQTDYGKENTFRQLE